MTMMEWICSEIAPSLRICTSTTTTSTSSTATNLNSSNLNSSLSKVAMTF